jgi:hypothetical protein
MTMPELDRERDELDERAEAWLKARHGRRWWIGNATSAEWRQAYEAAIAGDLDERAERHTKP